ncbi:Rho GTPase activation protein [Penicillium expansum]|nr:Rho GTPase activation protein [Penicillium expansum]
MSTNLKSAMPSGLPSGLSSGLPPGLGNNINIDPSPFTTSFSGDFLGLPIPDDDQLWGLSPISPMATGWDKPDSAALPIPHSSGTSKTPKSEMANQPRPHTTIKAATFP